MAAAGEEADVQILIDGSDSNTASIALGYAESVVRMYSLALRTDGQNRKGATNRDARISSDILGKR